MKEIDKKLFEELCKDDLDGEIEECSKSKNVEEGVLDEGTSNFPYRSEFPLLVFYTHDEFLYNMTNDPNYPQEEQFEQEDENGHFYVDWDAFEEAKDVFEQKYWDENEICVLDDDSQERLESKLDDFNDETSRIANNLYDANNDEDYYALKDIELKIEAGYYEAAYIDIDDEDQFKYMSESLASEQRERFNNFFKELKKEFGLTQLGLAYHASNGETGFNIVKDESLEDLDEKKKKKEPFVKVDTGFDLAKDTIMTNHMLGSDCCEDFDEYDTDSYYDEEDICIYQFPYATNEKDIAKAKEYGLTYLGIVNDLGFQPGDKLIKGKYKDLKRYCDEYLDYVMHPYYLYKEEDIDLEDILEPATESLKESMKSEVTKWWKDVEDANREMKWEFNIDNGDYSDVEAMHTAMFDMLNDLKEKDASELFNRGKEIYNKYAKFSKYNESLKEALGRYKIEYWVDEEARDQGFGDFAIETFDDLEDAKDYADKLFSDVASVEVLDTQDNDNVVYGRYPEDESMNESKETNERKRLKYLLDKEECCTLDKGERFELQNLIQKYGYPENESVITNDKNIDAIKDEVNPSDVIPQEEQDALAKGEVIEEGGPGSGDHRDASQRYNDRLHATFRRFDEMNNKMAQFLLDHGVESAEVEELKKNTGLHGNALHQKLIELGLDDEFFERKNECKESINAWSIKANPTNEEIEIYVKKNGVWEAFASIENCPTKDMLEEDIIKEYSKVAYQVIKEAYNIDRKYGLYLEVKDKDSGKITKEEKPLITGSKKECDEKKKQLEETSPEDSHGNKNKYIVKELR